jgi:hypothetical protein
MMNTKLVAGGLAVVLLGGGLAAGLAGAGSGGGSSSDVTADTVSMKCAGNACNVVFIPPSTDTVHPLGLDVQLVRADANEAVFAVGGQTVTVRPDRPITVQGATLTLTSPPNPLVLLHVSKS